jgi:hypothetical protein
MLTPDGKIKPWREMTPEERAADKLRHFPTLLNRWKGGYARFWLYSVSHCSFVIRIERAGVKGNLEIGCSAEHICGPVAWLNANVEVSVEPGVGYVIQDRAAGVRVIGAAVSIAENVKPVYVGFGEPEWSAGHPPIRPTDGG